MQRLLDSTSPAILSHTGATVLQTCRYQHLESTGPHRMALVLQEPWLGLPSLWSLRDRAHVLYRECSQRTAVDRHSQVQLQCRLVVAQVAGAAMTPRDARPR